MIFKKRISGLILSHRKCSIELTTWFMFAKGKGMTWFVDVTYSFSFAMWCHRRTIYIYGCWWPFNIDIHACMMVHFFHFWHSWCRSLDLLSRHAPHCQHQNNNRGVQGIVTWRDLFFFFSSGWLLWWFITTWQGAIIVAEHFKVILFLASSSLFWGEGRWMGGI